MKMLRNAWIIKIHTMNILQSIDAQHTERERGRNWHVSARTQSTDLQYWLQRDRTGRSARRKHSGRCFPQGDGFPLAGHIRFPPLGGGEPIGEPRPFIRGSAAAARDCPPGFRPFGGLNQRHCNFRHCGPNQYRCRSLRQSAAEADNRSGWAGNGQTSAGNFGVFGPTGSIQIGMHVP